MRVTLRKSWILPVAVLGVCLLPATSRASLTITLGNGSATNTLQFRSQPTPTTVLLEDTAVPIDVIQITVDQSAEFGPGQASLQPTGTNFSSVKFDPVGPFVGFEAFEVNPRFTVNDGTFDVTGFDQFGNLTTVTLDIANGVNRFNIETDVIQYITQVVLTTSSPIIDNITQVRVGGLVTDTAVVPEPSTLLGALLGIGLGGVAGWRRMRRGPLASS